MFDHGSLDFVELADADEILGVRAVATAGDHMNRLGTGGFGEFFQLVEIFLSDLQIQVNEYRPFARIGTFKQKKAS